MNESALNIHHIEPTSRVNGPGLRAVVWVQGCTLGCPGCFNPETHPTQAGKWVQIEQLVEEITHINGIEGLTISGGEPFQQASGLARFLKAIKEGTSLSVLVFTGFTLDEIGRIPASAEILACTDVLLAGRYQAAQRLGRGLFGSANKKAHFLTSRYSMSDLEIIPEAEILIKPDGTVIMTGIDPVG